MRTMQAINYSSLLGTDAPQPGQHIRSRGNAELVEVYRHHDGVQYKSREGAAPFFHEIVRISQDALLLATDCSAGADAFARQIVDQDDWVHVQFRIDGDGYESLPESGVVQTPPRS